MRSQLNRNSSHFIAATGSRYQLDHSGDTSIIAARRWAVKAGARLANAGGNVFFAARNVYEFLTTADCDAAAGDIVTAYSAGAPGNERFFLYLTYMHEVSELISDKKFFALRINVNVDFYRLQDVAGPMGGSVNKLSEKPLFEDVPAHFSEARETVKFSENVRSEDFAGFLVTKKNVGFLPLDRFQIDNKWYEIQGYDSLALEGLQINNIARVK